MAFHSLYGRIFGVDTLSGQPYAMGRPVGSPMPAGLGIGNTFYVSSAVAGTDGRSPGTAVATIVAATALCTANQGDTVVVLPNHTENIAAATALCGVAGVRIIGVGVGANRPIVTFTTLTTAAYSLAVAGTYIENIVFAANLTSIAAALVLTTAKDTWVVNCEFRDLGATLNFLNCVKGTGAANTTDGLTCIGNTWNGLGTTSVNSFVLSADACARCSLLDNKITLARTATAAILMTVTTGVLIGFEAAWNYCYSGQTATTGGSLVSVGGTTSTGPVHHNFVQTLTTTSDLLFTTTVGLAAFENRVTGVVGATGFVIPAVDS